MVAAMLLAGCAGRSSYRSADGEGRTDAAVYHYSDGSSSLRVAESRVLPGESGRGWPWPKTFVSNGVTNTVHQLQIDSWDGSAITGRNAVAVQGPGQGSAIYGVVTVRATTVTDEGAGTVSLLNFQVVEGDFPSAPEREEELVGALRRQYPGQAQVMALETLRSQVAASAERAKVGVQELRNDPPKIIVSEKPAVLVYVDGEPALRAVEGTGLQRVINTRFLLVKDGAGKFYLSLGKVWLSASELKGPWARGSGPAGWERAEQQARAVGELDVADEEAQAAAADGAAEVPVVYVSTVPTELVVTDGAAEWVPIGGTQLLYVTNTTGNVFKHLGDQKNYLLLSGRWYRGSSFEGAWEFVPGRQLPPDFGRIPDDSPKENVKASVPGTPQAEEALIANSIPQTTAVQRASQMPEPQIDGPVRLEPIGGTPLQYVANSGTAIIRVDEKSWYACHNGVWYVATGMNGPWAVADHVPAVIYSIPASSPMHYVTYVRVYDATDAVVYQGYTPGYLGTVVDSDDAVVVYGTGYYYRPWVGSVWYGYPVTWGLGVGPFWSPWYGWSYGFGFGWYGHHWHHHHYPYWGWYHPYPWWGPYRYYARSVRGRPMPHRLANTSMNVYRRPTREAAPTLNAFNRQPVYGRAYNSRTGSLVAGEGAQVDNVFRSPARNDFRNQRAGVSVPRTQTPGVGEWRRGRVGPDEGLETPAPTDRRSSARAAERGSGNRAAPSGGLDGFDRRSRSDGEGRSGRAPAYSAPAPSRTAPPAAPPGSRSFPGGRRERG